MAATVLTGYGRDTDAVFDLFGVAVKLHRRMKRQIARRFATSIKMLVKPFIRRHKAARLMPGDHDFVFALFPHDRITLADRNDDHPTGTMAVCFFV